MLQLFSSIFEHAAIGKPKLSLTRNLSLLFVLFFIKRAKVSCPASLLWSPFIVLFECGNIYTDPCHSSLSNPK